MSMSSLDRIVKSLDRLVKVGGGDHTLTITVGNSCCWSAELRITPNPCNPNGPDRSVVYYATGGGTAKEVAEEVLKSAQEEFGTDKKS